MQTKKKAETFIYSFKKNSVESTCIRLTMVFSLSILNDLVFII